MVSTPAGTPERPILLTGASGNLGRSLSRDLGAQGWPLRLTDIAPFPDAMPQTASFTGNAVAERRQVGAYCASGYSRQAPSPADLFKD